jgi:hypothetical protein
LILKGTFKPNSETFSDFDGTFGLVLQSILWISKKIDFDIFLRTLELSLVEDQVQFHLHPTKLNMLYFFE